MRPLLKGTNSMRNRYEFACLLFLCMSSYSLEPRELVDKIVARVEKQNIYYSATMLPHIGDEHFTLDELIDQQLFFRRAQEHGGYLMPTSLDTEKSISLYKDAYGVQGLSESAFEQFLREKQFTYKRFKHEIIQNLAITNYISSFVQGHVFVTDQEVRSYYAEHPEYTEEEFFLKTALIPFDRVNKVTKKIPRPKADDWVVFDEWIKKSDIASEMKSIFTLEKGKMSRPVKTANGYQFIFLVDKKEARLKTLDERYVEIQKKLHADKMKSFETTLRKDLRSKAIITYLK